MFSVNYLVQRGDCRAFLKALDYSWALHPHQDTPKVLSPMVRAYEQEKNLLTSTRRMSQVVSLITSGHIYAHEGDLSSRVDYLILEKGEGDLRDFDSHSAFDNALKCRVLHGIALGVQQLHSRRILHRDIKPSNVLIMGEGVHKIGDLGSALVSGDEHPLSELGFKADMSYYPPEILYDGKTPHPDYATDLYLLGSLGFFMFLTQGITPLLLGKLNAGDRHTKRRGEFQAVLPLLSAAYTEIAKELREKVTREFSEIREHPVNDLLSVLERACHPNPLKRGMKNHTNRFDTQPYVSIFHRLSREFEIKLKREA